MTRPNVMMNWQLMKPYPPILLQDGRINYDEFVAMMRKGNPELVTNRRRRWDPSDIIHIFFQLEIMICLLNWVLLQLGYLVSQYLASWNRWGGYCFLHWVCDLSIPKWARLAIFCCIILLWIRAYILQLKKPTFVANIRDATLSLSLSLSPGLDLHW